jgi:hypothetical protein
MNATTISNIFNGAPQAGHTVLPPVLLLFCQVKEDWQGHQQSD